MPESRWSRCPRCGGPIHEVRLGVPLTALKARIFDAVSRAGDVGIAADDLRDLALDDLAFGDRAGRSRETLKSHISQINELLAAGDWRIRSVERRYRLMK